jgi:hypothetical protein
MSEKYEKKIGKYYIDPSIFTFEFVNCCDVSICGGECCYYGVYTDYKEYETILSVKDRIIQSMDDSQTKDINKWFEPPEEDEDFDSGKAVGTEVYNRKCVFLDKQGYCTLQKIAIEDGEFKWKYKPLYCILFPLVIYNGAIMVDTDHLKRLHYCSIKKNQVSTIFECCRNELKHLLGEEGFAELEDYRTEYLNEINYKKRKSASKR